MSEASPGSKIGGPSGPASGSASLSTGFAGVAALVFGALTLIVLGDAAAKTLVQGGFSPVFTAWGRFALAAVLLLPVCGIRRDEWRLLIDWRIVLRAVLIVCAISCILTALETEPIANVFGGFFIGPVVSYGLSVILLKERVTLARTAFLFVGFAGVMLVVKPGFGATTGMAFAVLSGCFHGAYLVATRWLAPGTRARFLLLSQLMIGAILLAPLGLGSMDLLGLAPFGATDIGPTAIVPDPPAMTGFAWAMIAISAAGSALGNYILVIVNRTTPASLIAPLIYTQLISATVVGYLVFAEWPDLISLLGLAVITVSGLGSLWLARRG